MEQELIDAADAVLVACRKRDWMLATAESCHGWHGRRSFDRNRRSSDVVSRGYVTYTNEAKHEMVGVPMALFERVGAVSEEVARAMAEGARATARVDVACGITGVAGPGGGSPEKPVGLVHIAAASAKHTIHEKCLFDGDRHAVRLASAIKALEMMKALADQP